MRILRLSIFFLVLLSCFLAIQICASPEETHKVVPNFYESAELNEVFSGKLLKNGDKLSIEDVQSEPSFSLCKTDFKKNYTVVLVDNDDNNGGQRAFMIIGNIPGNGSLGTYKLAYLAPTEAYLGYHSYPHVFTFILYEMAQYIPRFDFKPECAETEGQKLIEPFCPDTQWPDCPKPVLIDDPKCVAWKMLPQHHTRNGFHAKDFAVLNNLTAVDVKWFQLQYPAGHPAHPDHAKLNEPHFSNTNKNSLLHAL